MTDDERKKAGVQTAWVIFAAIILGIIYDAVMWRVFGGIATISSVVGNWSAASIWVAVVLGALFGHLIGSGDEIAWSEYALRLAVAAVSIAVGFIATRLA